jgi:hypothetical protein
MDLVQLFLGFIREEEEAHSRRMRAVVVSSLRTTGNHPVTTPPPPPLPHSPREQPATIAATAQPVSGGDESTTQAS